MIIDILSMIDPRKLSAGQLDLNVITGIDFNDETKIVTVKYRNGTTKDLISTNAGTPKNITSATIANGVLTLHTDQNTDFTVGTVIDQKTYLELPTTGSGLTPVSGGNSFVPIISDNPNLTIVADNTKAQLDLVYEPGVLRSNVGSELLYADCYNAVDVSSSTYSQYIGERTYFSNGFIDLDLDTVRKNSDKVVRSSPGVFTLSPGQYYVDFEIGYYSPGADFSVTAQLVDIDTGEVLLSGVSVQISIAGINTCYTNTIRGPLFLENEANVKLRLSSPGISDSVSLVLGGALVTGAYINTAILSSVYFWWVSATNFSSGSEQLKRLYEERVGDYFDPNIVPTESFINIEFPEDFTGVLSWNRIADNLYLGISGVENTPLTSSPLFDAYLSKLYLVDLSSGEFKQQPFVYNNPTEMLCSKIASDERGKVYFTRTAKMTGDLNNYQYRCSMELTTTEGVSRTPLTINSYTFDNTVLTSNSEAELAITASTDEVNAYKAYGATDGSWAVAGNMVYPAVSSTAVLTYGTTFNPIYGWGISVVEDSNNGQYLNVLALVTNNTSNGAIIKMLEDRVMYFRTKEMYYSNSFKLRFSHLTDVKIYARCSNDGAWSLVLDEHDVSSLTTFDALKPFFFRELKFEFNYPNYTFPNTLTLSIYYLMALVNVIDQTVAPLGSALPLNTNNSIALLPTSRLILPGNGAGYTIQQGSYNYTFAQADVLMLSGLTTDTTRQVSTSTNQNWPFDYTVSFLSSQTFRAFCWRYANDMAPALFDVELYHADTDSWEFITTVDERDREKASKYFILDFGRLVTADKIRFHLRAGFYSGSPLSYYGETGTSNSAYRITAGELRLFTEPSSAELGLLNNSNPADTSYDTGIDFTSTGHDNMLFFPPKRGMMITGYGIRLHNPTSGLMEDLQGPTGWVLESENEILHTATITPALGGVYEFTIPPQIDSHMWVTFSGINTESAGKTLLINQFYWIGINGEHIAVEYNTAKTDLTHVKVELEGSGDLIAGKVDAFDSSGNKILSEPLSGLSQIVPVNGEVKRLELNGLLVDGSLAVKTISTIKASTPSTENLFQYFSGEPDETTLGAVASNDLEWNRPYDVNTAITDLNYLLSPSVAQLRPVCKEVKNLYYSFVSPEVVRGILMDVRERTISGLSHVEVYGVDDNGAETYLGDALMNGSTLVNVFDNSIAYPKVHLVLFYKDSVSYILDQVQILLQGAKDTTHPIGYQGTWEKISNDADIKTIPFHCKNTHSILYLPTQAGSIYSGIAAARGSYDYINDQFRLIPVTWSISDILDGAFAHGLLANPVDGNIHLFGLTANRIGVFDPSKEAVGYATSLFGLQMPNRAAGAVALLADGRMLVFTRSLTTNDSRTCGIFVYDPDTQSFSGLQASNLLGAVINNNCANNSLFSNYAPVIAPNGESFTIGFITDNNVGYGYNEGALEIGSRILACKDLDEGPRLYRPKYNAGQPVLDDKGNVYFLPVVKRNAIAGDFSDANGVTGPEIMARYQISASYNAPVANQAIVAFADMSASYWDGGTSTSYWVEFTLPADHPQYGMKLIGIGILNPPAAGFGPKTVQVEGWNETTETWDLIGTTNFTNLTAAYIGAIAWFPDYVVPATPYVRFRYTAVRNGSGNRLSGFQWYFDAGSKVTKLDFGKTDPYDLDLILGPVR